MVDDFHTAVWFALHTAQSVNGRYIYGRSVSDAGWIVLISAPRGIKHQDLRETQSSRTTRCHVQQGWSPAMQDDAQAAFHRWQDFAAYVMGTVRIPNCRGWHVTGFLASQSFLFPKKEVDDTNKQLQSSEVADLAYTVECEEDLAPGTLGHAALYLESADTSAV